MRAAAWWCSVFSLACDTHAVHDFDAGVPARPPAIGARPSVFETPGEVRRDETPREVRREDVPNEVRSDVPDDVLDCLERHRAWRGDLVLLVPPESHVRSRNAKAVVLYDNHPAGRALLLVQPKSCRVVGFDVASGRSTLRRTVSFIPGLPRSTEVERHTILQHAGYARLDDKKAAHAVSRFVLTSPRDPAPTAGSTIVVEDVVLFDVVERQEQLWWYEGLPPGQESAWVPSRTRANAFDLGWVDALEAPRPAPSTTRVRSTSGRADDEIWWLPSRDEELESALALFDGGNLRFTIVHTTRLDRDTPSILEAWDRLWTLGPCSSWEATCLSVIEPRGGRVLTMGINTTGSIGASQVEVSFEGASLRLEPKMDGAVRFGIRRVRLIDLVTRLAEGVTKGGESGGVGTRRGDVKQSESGGAGTRGGNAKSGKSRGVGAK